MCGPLPIIAAIGTGVSAAGQISAANKAKKAGAANAAALKEVMAAEKAMTAIEDVRTRSRFRTEMRKQSTELAARGIALDSPTAMLLAEQAGRELSFMSQGIRQKGEAKQAELKTGLAQNNAMTAQQVAQGQVGAASTILNAVPDIFPGLGG